MSPSHPYYPPSLLLPTYTPNIIPLPTLLLTFLTLVLTLLTTTLITLRLKHSHLPRSSIAKILWFTLCGALHTLFESYFLLHHRTLSSENSLPAQLWKEYALSDSRYLTSDPLVLTLEWVTVCVWGPGCFLAAWGIAKNESWGVVVMCVVSLGHVVSCVLYFAGVFVAGVEVCRPEAVYYWGYLVGLNGFWIVVPGVLLWRGGRRCVDAIERCRVDDGRKRM